MQSHDRAVAQLDSRQRDNECRAVGIVTLEGERPAVADGYDVVTEAEAKARTAPGRLRRKERLEYSILYVLWDTPSVVSDPNHHLTVASTCGDGDRRRKSGSLSLEPVGNGIEGVACQIQDNPPDISRDNRDVADAVIQLLGDGRIEVG